MPKVGTYNVREYCSLCRSDQLALVLGLGDTPIANEYGRSCDIDQEDEVFPLDVLQCAVCGHAQIGTLVDPKRLFPPGYAYATGTSPVTVEHLNRQWQSVKEFYEKRVGLALDERSFVVEIGSNDGTLLGIIKRSGVENVLGVEPASRLCEHAKKEHEVKCINQHFTSELGSGILKSYEEADVVIANNVFAHVPDVRDMAEGVSILLADGGLFVFEVSYLMDMTMGLFDTIYHEHMSYHSVRPLALMLDDLGMPIVSAEYTAVQMGRGSLRIIARKGQGRSVDCENVRSYMLDEAGQHAWSPEFFTKLATYIRDQRECVLSWVDALQKSKIRLFGYGAAAKTTTFMSVMQLGKGDFDFIIDDSERKQGLLMPGSRIKIYHPNVLKRATGTCAIFAWNFADSIMERNSEFKGTWLTFLPKLKETKAMGR